MHRMMRIHPDDLTRASATRTLSSELEAVIESTALKELARCVSKPALTPAELVARILVSIRAHYRTEDVDQLPSEPAELVGLIQEHVLRAALDPAPAALEIKEIARKAVGEKLVFVYAYAKNHRSANEAADATWVARSTFKRHLNEVIEKIVEAFSARICRDPPRDPKAAAKQMKALVADEYVRDEVTRARRRHDV